MLYNSRVPMGADFKYTVLIVDEIVSQDSVPRAIVREVSPMEAKVRDTAEKGLITLPKC